MGIGFKERKRLFIIFLVRNLRDELVANKNESKYIL